MDSSVRGNLDGVITKEIQVLGLVLKELREARSEINNDLTRLAVKNLPLMAEHDLTVETTEQTMNIDKDELLVASTSNPVSIRLSQSTEESSGDVQNHLQELEPLDLDL